MRNLLRQIFKVYRLILRKMGWFFDDIVTVFLFYVNNVEHSGFTTSGVPFVSVAKSGRIYINKKFKINNTRSSNPIGGAVRCNLIVGEGAILNIGRNVGMSSTTVVCKIRIDIGNDVKIGGNVVIYDTDFHSLNSEHRKDKKLDKYYAVAKPIVIASGVFIGAYSIILKGVSIGENSIIGAGSVVSTNIPSNEVWAGNPARKIRELM